MTYGFPLIFTGIVCCAVPPSLIRKVLITLNRGSGRRSWISLVSRMTKPLVDGAFGLPRSASATEPGDTTYARVPSSLIDRPWLRRPMLGMLKVAIIFGLL